MISTIDRIRNLLIGQLGIDRSQITAEANLIEDLGADSLDTVEIVMLLEEEFGVEVYDEDASEARTVGDLVKMAEALL